MKRFKFRLVGALILATLSCSLFSPKNKNDKPLIYENDAFSFTIPSGWEMALFGGDHFDLNVEKVVTVYDNPIMFWSKRLFTVASSPLDGDLETHFTHTYEKINLYDTPFMEVKTQGFERGVLSGLEVFYSYQYGERIYSVHDIWLEKDDNVFVLSFYAQPAEYNNYTDVFDQILGSFRFKE